MVNLDGSVGEGGGQMLRTALVWSLITQTPFRMENIRAGRRPPGLKAQHVHVLQALLPLGDVKFTGAQEGSSVVTFSPAPLKGASFEVDIGTAGSITLVLQTLLPAALLASGPSEIRLTGGTDVRWSPPLDYLRDVILGLIGSCADRVEVRLERRGFYPRGGGRVIVAAEGMKPRPIGLEARRALRVIRVHTAAAAALAERRVAERQSAAAAERLRGYGVEVEVESDYSDALSPGSVTVCVAEFEGGARLGGSALGERGKPAERVGREGAEELAAEIDSGGLVDRYAADQIIVWLALAGGTVRASRISEHARTNLWVTEQFLGRGVTIEGELLQCNRPLLST